MALRAALCGTGRRIAAVAGGGHLLAPHRPISSARPRLSTAGRPTSPSLLPPAASAVAAASSSSSDGSPPSSASYRTAAWPPRRRPAGATPAAEPAAAASSALDDTDHHLEPPAATGAASEEEYAKLVVPPPPPPSVDAPGWAESTAWARSPLDVRRRIFCNRSLNMGSIKAIGFDMDYTLAQYKPDTFEALAYRLTVDKLVTVFGYPPVLREFEFDWRYMTRGLVIDKKRGNVLKVDRHKYVKLAYHGFRPLSRAERLATYANAGGVANGLDEPEYALIDTLFSLAEAHLFMQLVELGEAVPGSLPASASAGGKEGWTGLYRDVRAAVDLCHRDGSLKSAVAASPGTYIHEDRRLGPLLDTLRASGRRLFLATNSLWDYTHVVMNYLLGGRVGPAKTTDWLSYFDVVVTGCGKPAFFTEKRPLFEVDPRTGLLSNTDGGSPMVPIGEADLPRPGMASTAPQDVCADGGDGAQTGAAADAARTPPPRHGPGARRARVFQGGTYLDLHRMLGVGAGTEVLYVGDHIYGDILRSKKSLGWRTMLVVPELEAELDILSRSRGAMAELRTLRGARDALEDQIQRLEWAVAHGEGAAGLGGGPADSSPAPGSPPPPGDDYPTLIANLKAQRDAVRAKHRALLRAHHERFHAVWGRLLKTGYQNSRFAHQVERFACLYTSHVANLHFVSPDKSFRATPDHMAHEYDPLLSDPSVPDTSADGGWGSDGGGK